MSWGLMRRVREVRKAGVMPVGKVGVLNYTKIVENIISVTRFFNYFKAIFFRCLYITL